MNKEKEVEAYLKGVLPEEQKLKYEIAQELGILDKVLESGWKSLSAKETGSFRCLPAIKRKEEKYKCNTKKIQKSIVWKLLRTVLFWYTDSSRY